MPLNIKHYDDLPLEKCPLKEVICQIKFPPLLEISQKLPVQFQTRIRKRFPDFSQRPNIVLDSIQPLPSDFEFINSDDNIRVALTYSSLAIATTNYISWESFRKQLNFVFNSFIKVYGEVPTSRLGLRYVNELTLENTETTSINELLDSLNNNLNCLIINDSWTLPNKALHQLSIGDDDNEITIRYYAEFQPKTKIILDFDYYRTLTSNVIFSENDILLLLDKYHTKCYDLFRWSIKDNKLEIFNPVYSERKNG
jgi:uncharacterized protein (TIGR04255 family)